MKKYLLFIGLFIALTQSARAAFVQAGHGNFSGGASTTVCPPGTVTSGNVEYMLAQANNATTVTVASTRVASWTPVKHTHGGSADTWSWIGVVTSSGVESITATLASGTTTMGSVCGEYSGTTVQDASADAVSGAVSLTTLTAVTTIIEGGSFPSGGTGAASPYTNRAVAQLTGTTFLCFGDVDKTSTGTYSSAFTGSNAPSMMVSLKAPNISVQRRR